MYLLAFIDGVATHFESEAVRFLDQVVKKRDARGPYQEHDVLRGRVRLVKVGLQAHPGVARIPLRALFGVVKLFDDRLPGADGDQDGFLLMPFLSGMSQSWPSLSLRRTSAVRRRAIRLSRFLRTARASSSRTATASVSLRVR